MFCGEDFFRAVGHPARQKILECLKDHELSVQELVGKVGLSQATVSHHLAILKDAKVVETRSEGKWVYYSVCCSTIMKCCRRMEKFAK